MAETPSNASDAPTNATWQEDSSSDIIENPVVQALFYALYATIFVVGLSGNVLVIYVVTSNRSMRTVTNTYLVNLALSDILLCLLAVLFTPLYTFIGEWVFGHFLCHLLTFSQCVSIYVSTLTLASVALDRFLAILRPFRDRVPPLPVIAAIWTLAVLLTLPYGLFTYVSEHDGKLYCEEHWPEHFSRPAFSLMTSGLQFVLPFAVIAYCYFRVLVALSKAKPGVKSSQKEKIELEQKRRTNRMLIAMVVVFGCSWLPLNLFNVAADFRTHFQDESDWAYINLCFFLAHSAAMSSTCYNPFVYAWLNHNFRSEFKRALPWMERLLEALNRKRWWGGYEIARDENVNEMTAETQMDTSDARRSMRNWGSGRVKMATVVYNAPTETVTIVNKG